MLVYLMSKTSLGAAPFPGCDCGAAPDHVCFFSRPLPGMGQWVYAVDLPHAVLEPGAAPKRLGSFEVVNYRVPKAQLAEAKRHEYAYNEITGGQDWRRWALDLEPKNDRDGRTSKVWISRAGVALARPTGDATFQVELTELFNPHSDYVIMETTSCGGQKWELTPVAGVIPVWADHPQRWHAWVHDGRVRASALDYIRDAVPAVDQLVEHALKQTTKLGMMNAWNKVADKVESAGFPLGRIHAASWTSVMAMPIRIAQRLSQHLAEEWIAPLPKPEFQDPATSGRVLLASPGTTVAAPGTPMRPAARGAVNVYSGNAA
jgi:hypothetical protein